MREGCFCMYALCASMYSICLAMYALCVSKNAPMSAPSSFEPNMSEYSPLSLMRTGAVPLTVNDSFTVLSSSSTWSRTAFCGFVYSNAVATSFPTNHGSPSTSTVLTIASS